MLQYIVFTKMAVTSLIIGHFYPDFAQHESAPVTLWCYQRTSNLPAQGDFYQRKRRCAGAWLKHPPGGVLVKTAWGWKG